jgi:RimJ/RimL family protein N-acetyltransferase
MEPDPVAAPSRGPVAPAPSSTAAAVPRRAPTELRTDRLRLRAWRTADREPFAAMNADPEVMRHIGSGVLGPGESDALRARLQDEWAARGHGLWAVERADDGAFLGFCGLTVPAWGGPGVRGRLEVGWRLRRDAWGHGYATEAGRAALGVAWDALGAAAAIALIHPGNARSLGVAERLAMRVVGTTRHVATGWDVLVLRARPGDPARD